MHAVKCGAGCSLACVPSPACRPPNPLCPAVPCVLLLLLLCSGPETFDITAPPEQQAAAAEAAGPAVCSLDLGLDTVCDPALLDEICALTSGSASSDGDGSGAASE